MKLFEPKAANTFVFATVSATAREGTAPDYKAISATSLEGALNQLDAAKMRNAYPYVMGRYDEQGRYCTYLPAIEGGRPARFILHPFADQAKQAEGWH
jgi:hypothetical protein